MSENKAVHNENIKRINEILGKNQISDLLNLLNKNEAEARSVKKKMEDKLAKLIERKNVQSEELVLKSEQALSNEDFSVTEKSEEVVKQEPEKAEIKNEKEEPALSYTETVKTESVKDKPQPVVENEQITLPNNEEKVAPLPKKNDFILQRGVFVNRDGGNKKKFSKNDKNEFRPKNNKGEFRPKSPNGDRPAPQNGIRSDNFSRPQKKNVQTYVAPPVIMKDDRKSTSKKKQSEKSYEDKRVMNKRALIRNNISIDDFDENKTGYRKFRPVKKNKEQVETTAVKIEKAVINSEIIPLKSLSEKIGITAAEITKRLFKEGIMKTINDSIDFDTAAFIAADLNIELELKLDKTAEDVLSEGFDTEQDSEDKLVTRPPVVTVMGHVDHGKTSLLDKIRKSNVTEGEAGGITQHIGAYQVNVGGQTITFLDTPGHAAFTAMRARGAQATDIAVLVVAADDGIMPQTIEAINHAKAAGVPIIVAVNKMDKPEANIERVKTGLTEHGLLPEEWGGDTVMCPISAKTGQGIDVLLENINLVAEMKELKANPDRKAKGVVIEARLDQSRGPIATILVQNGTLKVGDSIIVGTVTGKVRAMVDDKGRRVASAGPSTPVSVMGLEEVPDAGDILFAGEADKLIKMVAAERRNKERENMIKSSSKVTLDDVFNKIAEGSIKGLNLIVKADVQGSVEAVKQSMEKLSNEEVKINVIHAAAGAIKESDIMLAESSNAIIIGFNVRPDSNAKQIAERSGVQIKLYRVIYEAIEDVEKALKGMLAPKFTEIYMGKAEVREVFKISGVGQVAGCYVTDGKIVRNGKLRIYRDDIMICEGNVNQLKRFKDDVKEVAYGFECGISIERFNDIKVGDFIESYVVEESKD